MIKQLASLVKIAKQKVQAKEMLLARNQNAILAKKQDIEQINVDVANVPIPKGGSFHAYQGQRASINAYLYEMDGIRAQIQILLQQQEEIKAQIRLANMEYEKMLYIYDNHKEEYYKQVAKNEYKNIDDISSMLYANKHRIS